MDNDEGVITALAGIAAALSLSTLAVDAEVSAAEGGKHLFILSGQSNMVGMDPAVSFTPAVTKAFGKEHNPWANS